jgi:hypothetical protein
MLENIGLNEAVLLLVLLLLLRQLVLTVRRGWRRQGDGT